MTRWLPADGGQRPATGPTPCSPRPWATSRSPLWQAGGATALFIAGFGAAGYATRRDLAIVARVCSWALVALIVSGIAAIFVRIPGGALAYPVVDLGDRRLEGHDYLSVVLRNGEGGDDDDYAHVRCPFTGLDGPDASVALRPAGGTGEKTLAVLWPMPGLVSFPVPGREYLVAVSPG